MSEDRWLGVLWGKSAERAGGRANLLLSHMLDTAAVGEVIWDFYLAKSLRDVICECVGGCERGRRFFAWLCGIHDWGKATPAFQHVDRSSAAALRDAGLEWDESAVASNRWRHDKAGAVLAVDILTEAGWSAEQVGWVWPLIAGHHGKFPSLAEIQEPKTARRRLRGRTSAWKQAQEALVRRLTDAVGFADLAEVAPQQVPSRAVQLQLSGFVVMADWIASNEKNFPGVDVLAKISMDGARKRAQVAWERLGLRRGWGVLPMPAFDDFRSRFDQEPRESQIAVMNAAMGMDAPGLLIVEAPMGEGKTKAALFAAEILAARFGLDGLFVGMPTQATSDPMFTNVRRWLARIDPQLPDQVALLHGKRRFNKEWQQMLGDADAADSAYRTVAEDEYGLADPYGADSCECMGGERPQRTAPAEWFLGSKRGLLAPFVVGTIDQLLFAATRSKHVMLRMAGLAGKVVILDEVHAADVYMSQFLAEGLRWLGQARIPVVLLSATLPPQQRRALVAAYLAGAASANTIDISNLPEPQGYPRVSAAWLGDDQCPCCIVDATDPWRSIDPPVAIEVLPEQPSKGNEPTAPGDAAVLEFLDERLTGGGCVLIIRNTVKRAQRTYRTLREYYGDDVRLLHGRLHVQHRADRTEQCLCLLGPDPEPARPARLILVATAVAEQSFDIDVDLLITDLAPMDLLLQRIGRMFRHAGTHRPGPLRIPTIVVTGFTPRADAAPWIVPDSEGIYMRYPLLRSAALILAGDCWSIPEDVPHLVEAAYRDEFTPPAGWELDVEASVEAWRAEQQDRAAKALPILLTRMGEHDAITLDGLHRSGLHDHSDEQMEMLVRDGKPTLEVVLVRHDGRGYRTMAGRWLGPHGEASPELLDELLGGTVRLPASLTEAARQNLGPLDGWRDHPWLRYSRALVLGESGSCTLDRKSVSYDHDQGLIVE